MNKTRAKKLNKVISQLDAMFEVVQNQIDGEQESYEKLSQKAQESEKGQEISAAISELEQALRSIDEAKDAIEKAIYSFELD